jgi:hypothetical protein
LNDDDDDDYDVNGINGINGVNVNDDNIGIVVAAFVLGALVPSDRCEVSRNGPLTKDLAASVNI